MKTFAELNFPGRLIAVEGLDGSGKSTQIYLLKRWLEFAGTQSLFQRMEFLRTRQIRHEQGQKTRIAHADDFQFDPRHGFCGPL